MTETPMADETLLIERDHEWIQVNAYDEPQRLWCKWCGQYRQVVYKCRPDEIERRLADAATAPCGVCGSVPPNKHLRGCLADVTTGS